MFLLTVRPPLVGPGSFSTMKHEMPSSVRAASATMPGALAVRDPHLRAVDDVLVAVARRPARDVARVAAGVGLRQREAAAELAGREARQPALLLRFGAVVHDQVRGDRVRVDDARQRHPAVRELLDDADVGEQVEPEAAVLLGDRDAEQPERLHLLDDRVGIRVGVLELRRDRDAPRARRTGARSRPARARTSGSVATVMSLVMRSR